MPWNGSISLLSNNSSSAIAFPAQTIPDGAKKKLPVSFPTPRAAPPAAPELLSVILLYNYWRNDSGVASTSYPPAQSNSTSSTSYTAPGNSDVVKIGVPVQHGPRRRFALLEALQPQCFYDIVGEVVKKYAGSFGDKCTLYVTDYTVNEAFYNYEWGNEEKKEIEGQEGDEYGYSRAHRKQAKDWKGPLGKRTIQVTLWAPNGAWADQNVNEGDYVALRNMNAQMRNGFLEGIVHGDRRYLEKVDVELIRDLSDAKVAEVKRRKKDYYKEFRKEAQTLIEYANNQKESKPDTEKENTKKRPRDDSEEVKGKARKKRKKEQRRAEQKAKELADRILEQMQINTNSKSKATVCQINPQG